MDLLDSRKREMVVVVVADYDGVDGRDLFDLAWHFGVSFWAHE